jgi:hypothetical protein
VEKNDNFFQQKPVIHEAALQENHADCATTAGTGKNAEKEYRKYGNFEFERRGEHHKDTNCDSFLLWPCPEFVLLQAKSVKLYDGQPSEGFQDVFHRVQQSAVAPSEENGVAPEDSPA